MLCTCLTEEALRVHGRYELEVVEALGLCPWAARARLGGKVRERVLCSPQADVRPSARALEEVARDDEAEVVFLIYPRLSLGRAAFDDFAARLRAEDAGRYPLGQVPFVFAVFHPDGDPDASEPERLIPFLRRTPDPTLQLVRASVLDAVRSTANQGTQFVNIAALEASLAGEAPPPPLRERIARTNLATARAKGIDAVRGLLDAIRSDRDASYAGLSGTAPDPACEDCSGFRA